MRTGTSPWSACRRTVPSTDTVAPASTGCGVTIDADTSVACTSILGWGASANVLHTHGTPVTHTLGL